jgi:hypothetical protein
MLPNLETVKITNNSDIPIKLLEPNLIILV